MSSLLIGFLFQVSTFVCLYFLELYDCIEPYALLLFETSTTKEHLLHLKCFWQLICIHLPNVIVTAKHMTEITFIHNCA